MASPRISAAILALLFCLSAIAQAQETTPTHGHFPVEASASASLPSRRRLAQFLSSIAQAAASSGLGGGLLGGGGSSSRVSTSENSMNVSAVVRGRAAGRQNPAEMRTHVCLSTKDS